MLALNQLIPVDVPSRTLQFQLKEKVNMLSLLHEVVHPYLMP